MRIFRLRGITVVMADNGEITPDIIQAAKESILAEVAEKIGGRVDGNTIITEENIQGHIFSSDKSGCAGEFDEIPRLRKEE